MLGIFEISQFMMISKLFEYFSEQTLSENQRYLDNRASTVGYLDYPKLDSHI